VARLEQELASVKPAHWTNDKPLLFMIGAAGAPEEGSQLEALISVASKYPVRRLQ
jgi:hypothetical protein